LPALAFAPETPGINQAGHTQSGCETSEVSGVDLHGARCHRIHCRNQFVQPGIVTVLSAALAGI